MKNKKQTIRLTFNQEAKLRNNRFEVVKIKRAYQTMYIERAINDDGEFADGYVAREWLGNVIPGITVIGRDDELPQAKGASNV